MKQNTILVILLIGLAHGAIAQNITGSTTANVGESKTYTFYNGTVYPTQNWTATNGTVQTKWSSGNTYYATVLWNTPGAGTVRFLDGSYQQRGSLGVTVSVAAPNASFTYTPNCGSTTITRAASPAPPTGVTWYWQTGPSGVITTFSGTTFSVTSTNVYYLRARHDASNTWSSGAQSTINVTVTPLPLAPFGPVDGNVISDAVTNVTVAVGGASGATSFNWYLTSNGTIPISGQTTTSYTVSRPPNSSQSYFVEAVNGACVSASRTQVNAVVHPQPILAVTNNGVIDLGDPVTISVSNYTYTTYQWLDANNNPIAGATNATYSTNVAGIYKVRVTKNNSAQVISDPITLSNPFNYIISTDILVDNITTESGIAALPIGSKSVVTQYFDGLGRPVQTVNKKGSPNQYDIVQPVYYDNYGREVSHYLPFVSTDNDGHYKDNSTLIDANGDYTHNFYRNSASPVAYDTRPFGKTVFEDSPLSRQLKSFGPGSDWHSNNKFIETRYLTNVDGTTAGDDKIINWKINATTGLPERSAINSGLYPNGFLSIISVIDEHNNEVRQYTNKEGQMILKMIYTGGSKTDLATVASAPNWARTYYIYDDLNNLRFVLQPELVKTCVETNTFVPTQIDLDNFAFQYQYDGRGRIIQKKVPGAGIVYMVYDERDRLVLTQDANQGALTNKEWTFTKYDHLNRPVLTGKYINNNDRATVQGVVDTYYNNLTASQAWHESYIAAGSGNVLGYDNKSFPQVATVNDYYSATYYDTYDTYIAPTGYTYLVETPALAGQVTTAFNRTTGLVTGTRVKNLVTNAWMRSVNYYDEKYRLVQSISDHQKGTLRTTQVYDFPGRVVFLFRRYVVNSVTTTIRETFTYDNGRLMNIKHSLNGATDVMTSKNTYNELGQLIDKQLHSTNNGVSFHQSVDYRYNIRGWLTKINEADVNSLAPGETLPDYFGMELGYQSSLSNVSSTAQFNGNISSVKWSIGANGGAKRQGYGYAYDPMNRLTGSTHNQVNALTGWAATNANQEENLSYDLNGNIKALTRKGTLGALMDILNYNYTGNRLNYVHDTGDPTKGFINGNTATDDYSYDANGNLNRDKNKGINNIGDIQYNYLNLPQQVNKTATEYVVYAYDATGRKLSQQVFGTTAKTTDYIGELIFENNTLKFINMAEGRILPDGANWEYQYHLKDHLGNVRVTFTTKAQTCTAVTANFESATNTGFSNYNRIAFDLVDKTDAGTTYIYVQKLQNSARTGVAKSIAVMPGDQVNISAYAKYMNLNNSTPNTSALITSLAAAFNVSAASTGNELKVYNGLNNYAATVASGNHDSWALDDEAAPKAFVTILFFDKEYNFVDAAWDQISTVGAQTSPSVKQPPHDLLSVTAAAKEAGFAYVFVSNEHPNAVEVFFDDVSVCHTPSPIVSSSDYFAFGLTFNSYTRENSTQQNHLYNGKELQDELSLGWLDYGARMYMNDLGRFFTQDRYSSYYFPLSPYNYTANNPINFVDYNGDYIVIYGQDDNGNQYSVMYEDGKAYHYTKDKTGALIKGKEYDGKNAFIEGAVSDLNSIGETKKGDERVSGLVNSKNQYSIREVGIVTDSKYDPKTKTISYSRTGGELIDGVKTRSDFTLGHEIEHGWRDEMNLMSHFETDRLSEEKKAVQFENYLRANAALIANTPPASMRLTYAGINIFSSDEKISNKDFGEFKMKRISPSTNGPGTDATRFVPNWKPIFEPDLKNKK